MTLIEFVFQKLRTPKTWTDKCLKSAVSDDSWTTNQHGKRAIILLKSVSEQFYHIY